MAKALYICYFGVNEPLVRTQVLPYLRELKAGGHEISLLTFEPSEPDETAVRAELAAEGIGWNWRRYHKRLSVLATAWDVLQGVLFVSKFVNRHKPDILHARVHVPMLMAVVARKISRSRPKILFDIRGFFPEEYVDAGVWPEGGWLYRATKRVEKWLMKEADGFVVLTEKAREILFPESAGSGEDPLGRPVEVIPCCVNTAQFFAAADVRDDVRAELGITARYALVYSGSFGGWYLSDELYELFRAARNADDSTFVMVLTQRDAEVVRERLISLGFAATDFTVMSVTPDEMPRYLNAADVAVSFIKRCYSKQASSPTKNAEYLAAGLPIIANSGVGDVDEVIETEHVGILVDGLNEETYGRALAAVKGLGLGDIRTRCRATAKQRFDMHAVGGERYRRIYRRLSLK